jgi:hypothetical protein
VRATITITASRREVIRFMREMEDPEDPYTMTPEQYFEDRVRDIADDELEVATMFGPLKVGAVKVES